MHSLRHRALSFLGLFPDRAELTLMTFVVLGTVVRLARLFSSEPIYGDQAAVGLNIINKSYSELLSGLDHDQVAPVGFLWIERLTYEIFGMNECLLRLWPAFTSIAALYLFARWSWLMVTPRVAVLTTGILAASDYSVRHGVELKPYGGDLMFSLLLLWLASLYLRHRNWRHLASMLVVTPFAILTSYPVVFIAGSIWLVLASSISWREKQIVSLLLLFGLAMSVTFFGIVLPISHQQDARTHDFMQQYWKNEFPPSDFLALPLWLIKVHTGNMFGYPIEGETPWCAGNFFLFILGINELRKSRQWAFLSLLIAPFALTLFASAIHRYPYGGSARITQHLVPLIVLPIGLGLLKVFESASKKWSWFGIQQTYKIAVLAMIFGGVIIFGKQFWKEDRREFQIRRFMRVTSRQLGTAPQFLLFDQDVRSWYDLLWYIQEQSKTKPESADSINVRDRSNPFWTFTSNVSNDQRTSAEVWAGMPVIANWELHPPSREKLRAFGFIPISKTTTPSESQSGLAR